MRRHKLLLAAGLFAYIVGASVRPYLCDSDTLCACDNAGCRIILVAQHPRAAVLHPVKAISFVAAPVGDE